MRPSAPHRKPRVQSKVLHHGQIEHAGWHLLRGDTGQVSNPSALTGHDYRIDFSGTAGAMQYSVVDVTTGTPVRQPSSEPLPIRPQWLGWR